MYELLWVVFCFLSSLGMPGLHVSWPSASARCICKNVLFFCSLPLTVQILTSFLDKKKKKTLRRILWAWVWDEKQTSLCTRAQLGLYRNNTPGLLIPCCTVRNMSNNTARWAVVTSNFQYHSFFSQTGVLFLWGYVLLAVTKFEIASVHTYGGARGSFCPYSCSLGIILCGYYHSLSQSLFLVNVYNFVHQHLTGSFNVMLHFFLWFDAPYFWCLICVKFLHLSAIWAA
jgi:hypothetical protein